MVTIRRQLIKDTKMKFAGRNPKRYLTIHETANRGKGGARVFYRTYLEDLTVSGRTWAEVHAIDEALHAAAFAPGGRYADDTWTTP